MEAGCHAETAAWHQAVARIRHAQSVAFALLTNVSLPVLRMVYARKVFSAKKGCFAWRRSHVSLMPIALEVFVIVKAYAKRRRLNLV